MEMLFQIDSRSTANLLPRKYAEYIKPYTRKILMWNKKETTKIKGQTTTSLINPKTLKKPEERFILYDDIKMSISKTTSEVHGLITINYKNFERISQR